MSEHDHQCVICDERDKIIERLKERINDFQVVMEWEGLSEKNNELLEELQEIRDGKK